MAAVTASLGPVLEPLLLGVLGVARPFAVPLLCSWGFAHFILGTSLWYLGRCLYLEVRHKVHYSFSAGPPVVPDASGAEPKATGSKRTPVAAASASAASAAAAAAAPLRGVEVVPAERYTARGQTLPPSKRVSGLISAEKMPAGELLDYPEKRKQPWHFGRAAKEDATLGLEQDEAWLHRRRCLREGAEVHRQVRQYVQQKVRPGMELKQIVEMVETASSALVGFDPKSPLQRGWAFPTGLSLNEVAAHDTVNPGDPVRYLKPDDIAKLDFGVHIEGHILDCAFTFTFDPVHDELMRAVKEATNEGIRRAGPDALVAEIGGYICEVMESYEVHRPDGKVFPVKAIKNLTGHSIAPYKIHAGKPMPSVNTGSRARMLPGELWAIETFGSVNGLGYVGNMGNCSHFMRPDRSELNRMQRSVLTDQAKSLLDLIERRFSTLAFCPRWLAQEASRSKSSPFKLSDQRWWFSPLEELCSIGVVHRYPPLADIRGSVTAQYEHTILMGSTGKEVLTRGTDY